MTYLLAGWMACAGSGFKDLEVAPVEAVVTVLEVRWRDDDPSGQAWVEHGPAGGPLERRSVEVEAEPGWRRVLVMGYPALTDVDLRPVVEREGERQVGRTVTAATGALPSGLPTFELLAWEKDAVQPGYLLGAGLGNDYSAVYVLDRDGQLVWYRTWEWGLVVMDVEEDLRGGLVVGVAHLDDPTYGRIERFGWDAEAIETFELPYAHHAVEQPAPGVYTCIQADIRENSDGQATIGDRLVQLYAEDGRTEELFNAWDVLPYTEHDRMAGRPEGLDWTHANGLRWDDARGSYLLSFRNLDLVLELDGTTGEVLRNMGVGGEYRVEPSDDAFAFPHSPAWGGEDSLLVFDSQSLDGKIPSRVIEYHVDDEALTLTTSWVWSPGDGRRVPALGEVMRLANGHTLTNWGTFGEIIEIEPSNSIGWRAVSRAGFILGSVHPVELWEPVD